MVGVIIVEFVLVVLALSKKSKEFPKEVTLDQAFKILEGALKQSYPELQEGYTWREVMFRLKSTNQYSGKLDWTDIENILKKYEAFRYGGIDCSDVEVGSVLHLAQKLPRRGKIVS